MTRSITVGLLITVTIVLIAWDIYVASNKTEGDTETEVLRSWSRLFPTLPYALGVVLGHFSADGFRLVEGFIEGLSFCISGGLLLLAWSIAVGMGYAHERLVRGHEFLSRRRYVPALLGYAAGGIFWGP